MDEDAPETGSGSLGRGLAILRAMNTLRPYASLRQLHGETKLPKPSIVRLLESFIAQGYIARTRKRGFYRLTSKIAELATGWDPVWAAVEAVERLPALLSDYKWPVAIGTRDAAGMLVLFSTRSAGSPYSFRPSTFGARAPLLTSAMGQAFLAYCDDGERWRAATDASSATDALETVLLDINRTAVETRARGYGLRLGQKGQDTSVSVPIFGARRELIGVIVETSFAAATSAADVQNYAQALDVTAGLLEKEIRRLDAAHEERLFRRRVPHPGAL